jgi:hypothetical protein
MKTFKKNTMGKMKEVFMDQFNNEYQGSHDAFIHGLAQATIEEFIKDEDTPCPNCNNFSLERNESEAACTNCGQDYILIGSSLRFK